jgi:hypothetical protein
MSIVRVFFSRSGNARILGDGQPTDDQELFRLYDAFLIVCD